PPKDRSPQCASRYLSGARLVPRLSPYTSTRTYPRQACADPEYRIPSQPPPDFRAPDCRTSQSNKPSEILDLLHVAFEIAARLAKRIAAKFFQKSLRENDRHHRLAN